MKSLAIQRAIAVSGVALLALVMLPRSTRAELMTFDVTVDQMLYDLGDTVNWQVTTTVSESTIENFGTAVVSLNLSDSLGEALQPATIGSAYSSYSVEFPGSLDSATGNLIEVGAANPFQLGGEVAKDGENLGPLVLASGSYTVSQPGTHFLVASAGSSNEFYTVPAGGLLGGATSDYDLQFNSASFEVAETSAPAAVPEPSSLIACLVAAAGCGLGRYRNRRRRKLATDAARGCAVAGCAVE